MLPLGCHTQDELHSFTTHSSSWQTLLRACTWGALCRVQEMQSAGNSVPALKGFPPGLTYGGRGWDKNKSRISHHCNHVQIHMSYSFWYRERVELAQSVPTGQVSVVSMVKRGSGHHYKEEMGWMPLWAQKGGLCTQTRAGEEQRTHAGSPLPRGRAGPQVSTGLRETAAVREKVCSSSESQIIHSFLSFHSSSKISRLVKRTYSSL